jgi:hypothetical protein
MQDFDIKNPPEEITVTIYLGISDEYGWLRLLESEVDIYTIVSEPVQVTFKIASREAITKGVIEGMRKEEQNIRAEAESKCKRIDEKIQSLLAIESK